MRSNESDERDLFSHCLPDEKRPVFYQLIARPRVGCTVRHDTVEVTPAALVGAELRINIFLVVRTNTLDKFPASKLTAPLTWPD